MQSQLKQMSDRAENHERIFENVSFGDKVQIIGLNNVTIGEGSCIADHVWLNVCIRDEKIRMKIGKCVLVGRQSMISTGGYLEIGDYCVFAPRVYVADADHIFTDISKPIMQQGATLGRSVSIEENCWLGINVVVSGHVTVGRGSVVAANSVVVKDVPPFCVVAGNPTQVIKMFNPQTKSWERTKTDEDRQRILVARNAVHLPSREEYRQIILKNATFEKIDPIVAGRGISI